jgi:hypothetical protein
MHEFAEPQGGGGLHRMWREGEACLAHTNNRAPCPCRGRRIGSPRRNGVARWREGEQCLPPTDRPKGSAGQRRRRATARGTVCQPARPGDSNTITKAGRKRKAYRHGRKRELCTDCRCQVHIAEAETFAPPQPGIAAAQEGKNKGGAGRARGCRSRAQRGLRWIERCRGDFFPTRRRPR